MSTEVRLEVRVIEGHEGNPSLLIEIGQREGDVVPVWIESRGIQRPEDIKGFLEDIAGIIQIGPPKARPFSPQPMKAQ